MKSVGLVRFLHFNVLKFNAVCAPVRFLVVPLKKQAKQSKSLNFKRIQGFIFFLQRQKVGFQSIFASENRGTFFDLGFSPTIWRILH